MILKKTSASICRICNVTQKKEWRKNMFHKGPMYKGPVHWKYILLLFVSVLTINIFPAPAPLIKECRPLSTLNAENVKILNGQNK